MAAQTQYKLRIVPAWSENVTVSYEHLLQNPLLYYNPADITWMIVASGMVFLMIPGISLLNSGLSDTSSAISLLRLPLMTTVFIGCQWFIFGYSIAFSPAPGAGAPDKTSFWGTTAGIFFRDVLARPVGNESGPQIPELVYALYQGMFAAFTASIVTGVTARKFSSGFFLLFLFLWSTFVYDPIARWTWHWQGWSHRNGSLDFAGGTAVHICSAAAAAACAVFHGVKIKFASDNEHQRREIRRAHLRTDRPHNITHVVIGTSLLWFGWIGFNGGSALGANLRAVSAVMSTNVAACFGGAVGVLICWEQKWRNGRRASNANAPVLPLATVNGGESGHANGNANGNTQGNQPAQPVPPVQVAVQPETNVQAIVAFCDGVIVALVAITPAAGYVPVYYSPFFGIVASVFLEFSRGIIQAFWVILEDSWGAWLDVLFFRYDILELSLIHGGGGLVGMFLTAFLKREWVVALDGYSKLPPDSAHHGPQLGRQLADAVAGAVYSFAMTFAILAVLSLPNLRKWRNRNVDAMPREPHTVALQVLNYRQP